jgi:hypothetical protein
MFQRMGMRRGGSAETAPSAAAQPATDGGPELDNRLKVRERLFAFGDDFWIENARSQRAYLVDGKALRVRDTLLFKDMQGQERYKLQENTIHHRRKPSACGHHLQALVPHSRHVRHRGGARHD